jgi:hypothetical protein
LTVLSDPFRQTRTIQRVRAVRARQTRYTSARFTREKPIMAQTILRYSVEVLVHVETDDTNTWGDVTRVVVDDERVKQTEAPPEVEGMSDDDPRYEATSDYAQQVADSAPWPAWTFGD